MISQFYQLSKELNKCTNDLNTWECNNGGGTFRRQITRVLTCLDEQKLLPLNRDQKTVQNCLWRCWVRLAPIRCDPHRITATFSTLSVLTVLGATRTHLVRPAPRLRVRNIPVRLAPIRCESQPKPSSTWVRPAPIRYDSHPIMSAHGCDPHPSGATRIQPCLAGYSGCDSHPLGAGRSQIFLHHLIPNFF